MESNQRPLDVDHHQQQELCTNRPAYRQGRKLTAVKTYTISTESPHLFIYGVPKINLRNELKKLCQNYGQVLAITPKENYKTEIFTECYHIHYERIQSARIAKRLVDNKSFYGGVLHVCYAPEFETVEETRRKLLQRTRDVMNRLNRSHTMQQIDDEGNGALQNFTATQASSYEDARSYNYEHEPSSSAVLPHNNSTQIQDSYELNDYSYQSNPELVQQIDTTQHTNNDTNKQEVETKLSHKKYRQTPAYFWKEPTEITTTCNKPSKKRSGNFVPRQVAKKKKS